MSNNSPSLLGNCARIVDEARELICNEPATEEILVRNKFGLYAVPLCARCKKEHFRFYAELRPRPTRRGYLNDSGPSQSRGRRNDCAQRAS